MGSVEEKGELRRRILKECRKLTREEVIERSSKIRHRFIELTEKYGFDVVMIYISVRKEVDTYELGKELLRMGKTVCAPVVDRAQRRILPYTLSRIPDDLVDGEYNIPEPSRERGRPVDPLSIDVVAVPGVGFDPRGYRIGYGGGYYDRFLPLCSNALFVGLAYEFQIVERVPKEAWDIRMDMIITEGRVIKVSKASGVRG
ncbi:TPA: 5-formyltetrahydrofolate cyclo-ligase [Candidatus Micrarchaeota archaeon]|nr:5-formyltetrahydrofolate cyclo-ligase [Candidatus Micrarchaeota archaeon]